MDEEKLTEYNQNYLRNAILELKKYNKPVIVTGNLQFNAYEYYYSFVDIKPFYPKYEHQLKTLCQHVNISKRQIDAVLNLYGTKDYTQEPLVLICKPYSYVTNLNKEERGGLNLTAELGIPGIMTYQEALQKIPLIDSNKYVDFLIFKKGYFLGLNEKTYLSLKNSSVENSSLLSTTNKKKKKPSKKNFILHDGLILNISKNKVTPSLNKSQVMLDGWFLKV